MENPSTSTFDQYQYIGPDITDFDTYQKLPADLQSILSKKNGYLQYNSAFHLRGCCTEPAWHSLAHYWTGDLALFSLYPNIQPDDIPFAENILGDQIFLREDVVWYLNGETGNIFCYNLDLQNFLQLINENPTEHLNCTILTHYLQSNEQAKPGQLLHAYPPLITSQAKISVTITAVDQESQLQSLSQLAAFFRKMDTKKSFSPIKKIKSLFSKSKQETHTGNRD